MRLKSMCQILSMSGAGARGMEVGSSMKTFIVELTVDVDDEEEISEKEIRKVLDSIDPRFGIFTVQNVTEE
jgi:hypothetical protein